MLVETVKEGNVTIRVHDDYYAGKTEKEIESIIETCCRGIVEALQRKEKTA